jgi:hypothetical protein
MAQAPLELAAVKRFDGLDLPLQVHDGVGEVDEAQFAARHVLDDVRPENLGLGLPGHEQAKHVPVGGIARVLPQGPVDVEAGIAAGLDDEVLVAGAASWRGPTAPWVSIRMISYWANGGRPRRCLRRTRPSTASRIQSRSLPSGSSE